MFFVTFSLKGIRRRHVKLMEKNATASFVLNVKILNHVNFQTAASVVASVSLFLPAAFSACNHQAVFSAPTRLHLLPKPLSPDFTLSNRSDFYQLGENNNVLIRDVFQFYAGHFCKTQCFPYAARRAKGTMSMAEMLLQCTKTAAEQHPTQDSSCVFCTGQQ